MQDIVFYNEAYSNSCSSGDGSPDFETAKSQSASEQIHSPQRGQSFLAAVLNAIRNATTSGLKSNAVKKQPPQPEGKLASLTIAKSNCVHLPDESDSTEMLDSETEPCLMMDNVLEDVQMPDSHSHNLVSTSMLSQVEVPTDMLNSDTTNNDEDDSFDNLSQAIADRQQIELHTGAMATRTALRQQSEHNNSTSDDISGQESVAEAPSLADFCTAQSLVDQVIDVDNLVTKLLKVLRLVQLDNDHCIQELVSDK